RETEAERHADGGAHRIGGEDRRAWAAEHQHRRPDGLGGEDPAVVVGVHAATIRGHGRGPGGPVPSHVMGARRRSETVLVTTVADGTARRHPDELIVEEPMTVQLDGIVANTTMRTPGNDFELAVGWCFTEGLLAGAPVRAVRYCADGAASDSDFNVVTVETNGLAPTPVPRLGTTTSSCGICGTASIDGLAERLAPLPAGAPIP